MPEYYYLADAGTSYSYRKFDILAYYCAIRLFAALFVSSVLKRPSLPTSANATDETRYWCPSMLRILRDVIVAQEGSMKKRARGTSY
jgi:hypothetical protein